MKYEFGITKFKYVGEKNPKLLGQVGVYEGSVEKTNTIKVRFGEFLYFCELENLELFIDPQPIITISQPIITTHTESMHWPDFRAEIEAGNTRDIIS